MTWVCVPYPQSCRPRYCGCCDVLTDMLPVPQFQIIPLLYLVLETGACYLSCHFCIHLEKCPFLTHLFHVTFDFSHGCLLVLVLVSWFIFVNATHVPPVTCWCNLIGSGFYFVIILYAPFLVVRNLFLPCAYILSSPITISSKHSLFVTIMNVTSRYHFSAVFLAFLSVW